MHNIKIVYEGELRTSATHIKSGICITTDAPIDNCGKGKAFSPTDLLASALGSCILTIMGIVADRHNVSIEGTHCKVTKKMANNPRKISSIVVDIYFLTKYNNYV